MSTYVSVTLVIASYLNVLYTTIQIQNMASRWLANDNKLLLENAPNGIRACLDFHNFHWGGCPRTPYGNWPPTHFKHRGRRGGLMVSALDSGSDGPGSSPGRGHCVVFLGKTLYSHSASLHPGV